MTSTASRAASATATVSFGWGGLIFLVLFILKVNPGGHLDSVVEQWPWWLITAPLWIVWAVLLVLFVMGLIGAGIAFGVAALIDFFNYKTTWGKNRRIKKQKERLQAKRATYRGRYIR